MADAFLSFAATVASSGGTEPTYTFAKVSFFRSLAYATYKGEAASRSVHVGLVRSSSSDIVLDEDRNPKEWSFILGLSIFSHRVVHGRLLERKWVRLDDSSQNWLGLVDTSEVGLYELNGGEVPFGQTIGELIERDSEEIRDLLVVVTSAQTRGRVCVRSEGEIGYADRRRLEELHCIPRFLEGGNTKGKEREREG